MIRTMLLLLAATACEAFNVARPVSLQAAVRSTVPARANVATMQFGKKQETLEERGYWAGEWVCADCGFIYEPGTEPPFGESP